ncbi:MAG: hypothetical protein NUV90_01640 [Candidatus Parcubacteria bacterium]|nr:hypothetical protein [Candidatus Parcubacteria bacterium]
MVKKLIKGSVYLFAFALVAILSLFAGNKGGYVLSTADSGGVPVAHADVPDPYYDQYAGAAGAGAGGCGAGGGVGGCGP